MGAASDTDDANGARERDPHMTSLIDTNDICNYDKVKRCKRKICKLHKITDLADKDVLKRCRKKHFLTTDSSTQFYSSVSSFLNLGVIDPYLGSGIGTRQQ